MQNETLFHDSTRYFALISGLLFSSILQARGYQRFYRSMLLIHLLRAMLGRHSRVLVGS